MTNRVPALGAELLLCITAGLAGVVSLGFGGFGVRCRRPSASQSPAPSGTFVKAHSAILSGSQLSLSPVDVQATSDGGFIALAETESSQLVL